MPDIEQIAALTYEAVLNDKRKAENQWSDNSALEVFEKLGMVVRKSLSDVIEATLDYRRNPGAKFLGSDLEPMSLAKTEVFTAAQYAPSQLSVPVEWSKMDDVKTPSENSKIAFVDGLLENALNSHDDLIEEALFASSTQGFVGLPGLFATSGQGSVGGIDSGVEVFWRHPADS
jgi:hypothetical protein